MTECVHDAHPENPCWSLTAEYAVDGVVLELPEWMTAEGVHTVIFSAPEDLQGRVAAHEVVALTARANGLSHRKAAALRDISALEQEADLAAAVQNFHATAPGDAIAKARVLGAIPGFELEGRPSPPPEQLHALSIVALRGEVSLLAKSAVAESGCALPDEAVLRMFDLGAFVVGTTTQNAGVVITIGGMEIAAQEFFQPGQSARHEQLRHLIRAHADIAVAAKASQEIAKIIAARMPDLTEREQLFLADRLQGMTTPQIAAWRNLTTGVIAGNLASAYKFMGVSGGMLEAAIFLSGKNLEDWSPPRRLGLDEDEVRLFMMVARRESNAAIAEAFSIEGSFTVEHAVTTMKHALYAKLGARNQVAAVWSALTAEDE